MNAPEIPQLQIEIQDVDWHKSRDLDWRFLGEFTLEAAGFLRYKNATAFKLVIRLHWGIHDTDPLLVACRCLFEVGGEESLFMLLSDGIWYGVCSELDDVYEEAGIGLPENSGS